MTLEREPTKLVQGCSPKLSDEQMEASLSAVRQWLEEGFCQPKMEPSLLGFDWSSFTPREFPQYAGRTDFWNPPEFIFYGFSAIDAYATAMLSTRLPRLGLGDLSFTCSLKRGDPGSHMYLKFMTTTEQGRIDPGSVMLDMLRSFPILLRTKGIEASEIFFLEGEGCSMRFAYPGRMVAKASQFLRNRPDDLWPQVKLSLAPTNELRIRARDIVEFLLSSTSGNGSPN